MSTLILSLPLASGPHAPEYDFVVLRDDGLSDAHGRALASLLPHSARQAKEVVAVIPGAMLSWHSLVLPARVVAGLLAGRTDAQRARAVLGGALEEHLLDEPVQLHFAVFGGAAAQTLWVATCDRAWLRAAVQALDVAGLQLARLVAEYEPMPDPATARVTVTDALAPAQAALCTAAGVSLLPLGDAVARLAQPHHPLELLAEPSVMGLAEQCFGVPAVAQTSAQRWIAAARSPWNLAQLEFKPSQSGRLSRRMAAAWSELLHAKHWQPLRYGLLALLLLQMVALNALAYKQEAQLEAQRAAVRSVLLETFPNVPVVIDAPLQMQREVAALARARGQEGADLARLLTAVGTVLGVNKPVTTLDFSAGALRVRASQLSDQDAADLTAVLGGQGWTAKLQGDQLVLSQQGAP
ncbi:type II secretion system protein GspL [Rhodoferax sp.]|jgi:general secretion pathway protein L|uniref:type II secretion system protein GspL n=1 Tax=Rhodoferax sp. TaxID=50421 RepID=UPI0037852BF5